eukprot:7668297-Lingulodinium_polyedra.AAC.1
MEQAVWGSRRRLWATRPPPSAAAGPFLDRYFQQRHVGICGERPSWPRVLSVVFAPSGVAPGTH